MENNLNLNSITEAAQPERLSSLQSAARVRTTLGSAVVGTTQTSDTAEFSEIAQLLGLAAESSDVRTDRVAQVRTALQSDEQQFVRERLAAMVDCLCDELSSS